MLSEKESKYEINKVVPQYRNCKISRGCIGLKANEGNLFVEDLRTKSITTAKVNILANYKLPNVDSFILSNDSYFINTISDIELIESNLYLMSKIDGITFL